MGGGGLGFRVCSVFFLFCFLFGGGGGGVESGSGDSVSALLSRSTHACSLSGDVLPQIIMAHNNSNC